MTSLNLIAKAKSANRQKVQFGVFSVLLLTFLITILPQPVIAQQSLNFID